MTHDELLARIDYEFEVETMGAALLHHSLRAVVELHKSFTPEFGGGFDYCFADDRPYPCPTIQAIEKILQ